MDCDFLIVGAGLAGGATAFQLRRLAQGASAPPPRVIIVEKEAVPGAHSSGRNAAIVRRDIEDHAVADLVRRGADILARGELAEFRNTGSFIIGPGGVAAADYVPVATGRGRWCPEDGVIDVAGLLAGYLRDQEVRYSTEVLGWEDDPAAPAEPAAPYSGPARPGASPPLRVRTTGGPLTTRVLVNAAGAWAAGLGGLSLTPTNRHLFVTPPMNTIEAHWPFVWDVAAGLYFRPESGGLLLCACDETPAAPGEYDEDPRVAIRLGRLLGDLQPGLGALRIMRTWVGQRTFAADRRFVVGYDPRDRRIFHVAALGGHGVTASPAVGRLAAEMLLSPDEPRAPNPFAPDRLL